jgi:hypothetical protein
MNKINRAINRKGKQRKQQFYKILNWIKFNPKIKRLAQDLAQFKNNDNVLISGESWLSNFLMACKLSIEVAEKQVLSTNRAVEGEIVKPLIKNPGQ